MKSKNRFPLHIFLAVALCAVYIVMAARPLGEEYQFVPEWRIDAGTAPLSEPREGDEAIPFKLGQTIGYFTSDGRVTRTVSFPFKAALSERRYAPYNANSQSIKFFNPDGTEAGTLQGSGFPLFDGDRIFLFLPGGSSFAQLDETGAQIWRYSGVAPITAFDSSPCACVAGFADGTARVFSPDGNLLQEFAPGGSDIPVMLGAAVSPDSSMVACVSGLNRQRFVLAQKDGGQTKIIFHEFLGDGDALQRLVQFTADGGSVYYNYSGALGVLDIKSRRASHIPLDGQALSLQECGNLRFVLARGEGKKHTVYAIEKFSSVIGSFSFDADRAFIRCDGGSLFVGKDSFISRIAIEKK